MRKEISVEDGPLHPIASTDERGFLTISNVAHLVDFIVPPPPKGRQGGQPASPPIRPYRPENANTKIVLGPLGQPPRPRSITVIDEPVSDDDGDLALNLAGAFNQGVLTDLAQRVIREALLQATGPRPLAIKAVLPPAHEIDLTLLARHLLQESESAGRDVKLFVSGGDDEY